MKSKSICKFISETTADTLVMHNFVCERNEAVMRKPNTLPCHMAILTIQGSGRFRFDNTAVTCTVGDLVFCFKDETMSCEPDSTCEYIYISFSGARAETLLHRFGIHKLNRHFHGFEGLIPLWSDSLSRASKLNIDIASESALLYAFSRFSSDEKKKGDVVNRAVRFLEENFTEPDLSLAEVADALGYNIKYLSHIFKEKIGMSFSEYLRMLRIKHAVMLFDHGLDSVKNVAFLSGFSDPLYFSSVFKSVVGISPTAYKAKT